MVNMVMRRFDAKGAQELVRLYEAGLTQQVLAERFDTTAVTVATTLRRAGAKLRSPGGPRREFTPQEIATIKRLYKRGESQESIARKLQTTQSKISPVLRREGLYSGRGFRQGQRHPLWKGGRSWTSDGYVVVKPDLGDKLAASMANGGFYVMEHRLVMARALGRPLDPTETVHHINGDKADNRLENLQLRNGKHGKGHTHVCEDCGSTNVRHGPLAVVT